MVIWAYENPHVVKTKSLHSPKLCVWACFSSKHKLELFFFDGTVDQHVYTDLLRNHLVPQLHQKRVYRTALFQHDGAPPHYSLRARDFLSQHFTEERVIGRGYGVAWPPRSPDLSPLDYYLWGMLKARVYHQFTPRNLDELKQKIIQEFASISVEELHRSVQNMILRCELVLENDGSHFEHFF